MSAANTKGYSAHCRGAVATTADISLNRSIPSGKQ